MLISLYTLFSFVKDKFFFVFFFCFFLGGGGGGGGGGGPGQGCKQKFIANIEK